MAVGVSVDDDGKIVIKNGKVSLGADCCNTGCTNPASPNYDPEATIDDGSCLTCCNQGFCVLVDPDCEGGCNSLTQREDLDYPFCNNNLTAAVCLDCCDSYCQNGCLGIPAPNDCHSSFASSYTVPAAQSCTGEEFTYPSCLECDEESPP